MGPDARRAWTGAALSQVLLPRALTLLLAPVVLAGSYAWSAARTLLPAYRTRIATRSTSPASSTSTTSTTSTRSTPRGAASTCSRTPAAASPRAPGERRLRPTAASGFRADAPSARSADLIAAYEPGAERAEYTWNISRPTGACRRRSKLQVYGKSAKPLKAEVVARRTLERQPVGLFGDAIPLIDAGPPGEPTGQRQGRASRATS